MFQEAPCTRELTDVNYAARMKRAKLLRQTFPQYATDFVFFTDEKVFSVASPDNRQTVGTSEAEAERILQCGHCAVCHCLAAC